MSLVPTRPAWPDRCLAPQASSLAWARLCGAVLAEQGGRSTTVHTMAVHPAPRRLVPRRPAPDRSSVRDRADDDRLSALVELARNGDAEAFGQLYDHYLPSVYRYVRSRVREAQLAEDLTAETFFRALRSVSGFSWQGRDFGAWLTTIARNLVADHYRSGRSRYETVTDHPPTDVPSTTYAADPAERAVASLTQELVRQAMGTLRQDQQECLVLRFLEELSVAETALVLDRSEGAVKQLQLRALRNLARTVSRDLR